MASATHLFAMTTAIFVRAALAVRPHELLEQTAQVQDTTASFGTKLCSALNAMPTYKVTEGQWIYDTANLFFRLNVKCTSSGAFTSTYAIQVQVGKQTYGFGTWQIRGNKDILGEGEGGAFALQLGAPVVPGPVRRAFPGTSRSIDGGFDESGGLSMSYSNRFTLTGHFDGKELAADMVLRNAATQQQWHYVQDGVETVTWEQVQAGEKKGGWMKQNREALPPVELNEEVLFQPCLDCESPRF